MRPKLKPVIFEGDSLDVIRAFPDTARRRAGYEIDRVQHGLDPTDWKPMPSVGAGVRKIRIKVGLQFRVIYVARLGDGIHVLHAFQKKTQKTPKRDIELAKRRLHQLTRNRDI